MKIPKLCSFVKPEIDYFIENCNFTDDELISPPNMSTAIDNIPNGNAEFIYDDDFGTSFSPKGNT